MGRRLWVRHKTEGKLFHRMVSQMRKQPCSKEESSAVEGEERILWSPLGQQLEPQHFSRG